ncbi:unnamed protein product [Heterobilharzia americana]|nr:unnamed protein product [Heterobilharzia americana]
MHRRTSTVDNPCYGENVRQSMEPNMMYLPTKELRRVSRIHRKSEGGCCQFDNINRKYSTSSRLEEEAKQNRYRVNYHSDEECTCQSTNSQRRRRYSFSQLLLRKASSISKRFRYYMVHSVALFHEDLYGLSWSEAHDILQSNYNNPVELIEPCYTHLKKPRKIRHYSTSAIPNYCNLTSNLTSNRISDVNPTQKHPRLYHLDKPHYIQCKAVEHDLTESNTSYLTKEHDRLQNISSTTNISEVLKKSTVTGKGNDTYRPPTDELYPTPSESHNTPLNMAASTVNSELLMNSSTHTKVNTTSNCTQESGEYQSELQEEEQQEDIHQKSPADTLNFDKITLSQIVTVSHKR